MVEVRTDGRRRAFVFALVCMTTALGLTGVTQRPAAAVVTAVRGSACGYITNVGLFGGPQAKLGCPPQIGRDFAPAGVNTLSPSVELPQPNGSATPITAHDPDGAAGKYGPATIFGGIWPEPVASAPPSGPITVSTQGTPAGGVVTSSADIGLHPEPRPVVGCSTGFTPPCTDPGGFGPPPVWGDTLHVECRATETSVTGSTTFTNAFIATATDSGGSPLPSATEPIPHPTPVNYTRSGVITNVGDVFTAVFNEHIVNPDGSLTVNGVHMYLFGPTAVGEMIKGQATCGTTPSALSPTDPGPPVCGTPVVKPNSPQDQTPMSPRQELIGVFDTGGVQSITNSQVTNGTLQVGTFPNNDSNPDNDYLKFTPGQTGPLAVIAVRTPEAEAAGLPLAWSFDVTDSSGKTTRCQGIVATSVTQLSAEPGDSISVSATGLIPSVSYRLRLGTTPENCRTSSLVLGGNVVSGADGRIGPLTRVIPTNATSGKRYVCWVRVGNENISSAVDAITIV